MPGARGYNRYAISTIQTNGEIARTKNAAKEGGSIRARHAQDQRSWIVFFEFNEAPVALARGKAIIEPETLQATLEGTALSETDGWVSDVAPAVEPEDPGIVPHIILDDFIF